MEGAFTCRGGGPKAMSKPWDKRKEVHLLMVTASFFWVLTEAGAGVARGLG